jgi:protein-S-isoprenylcysteine O-methyltransferase Ste14
MGAAAQPASQITRNPMYLGLALIYVGIAIADQRTPEGQQLMSAFGGKADIAIWARHVRF